MTRLQWSLVVAGGLLCAVGVLGSLVGERTDPVRVAVLLVGSAVLHDLVLVPLVLLTGLVLRRLPGRARGPVQGALLVCAVVVLASVPVLGRFGARPDDPSLLPRDYTAGLAVVLLAVALVAAVLVVARARRRSGRVRRLGRGCA